MLDRLTEKLSDIARQIAGKAHISERNVQEAIEEIKIALLEADVNVRVVRRFINATTEEALGQKVLRSVTPAQQFVKIVYERLVQLLGERHQELRLKGPDALSVILLVGLQGSGKTTTAAKLALFLKGQGRRPILAAADLQRPAAVEQLVVLAGKAGVEVFREGGGSPLVVTGHALEHAARCLNDVVIVDTAGRLQIDEPLMRELDQIRDICRPVEILLVADAMTGQNAVEIAQSYGERLGLTGVILSKFDSDTRGGAALSIRSVAGCPILFTGTGEKLDDFEAFYPERIASRILGMGDMVSLVEKAQRAIAVEDAAALKEKIERESFSLEDYLEQFERMHKMGSIRSLLEMVPGMKGAIDAESLDEGMVKRDEAIIRSMTRFERRNHRIIGPSRKSRIARGSGTSVYDINRLIKNFEKTCALMKKMSKNRKAQEQLLAQYTTK